MRPLCNCHTKFLVGTDKKVKNSTCISTSVLFVSVHKLATKNCWLASTITQLSTGHPNSTSLGLLLTMLLSLLLQDHRTILVGSDVRRFVVKPPTQKWSAMTLTHRALSSLVLKTSKDHLLFQQNLCVFRSVTVLRKQSFPVYFLISRYPN